MAPKSARQVRGPRVGARGNFLNFLGTGLSRGQRAANESTCQIVGNVLPTASDPSGRCSKMRSSRMIMNPVCGFRSIQRSNGAWGG